MLQNASVVVAKALNFLHYFRRKRLGAVQPFLRAGSVRVVDYPQHHRATVVFSGFFRKLAPVVQRQVQTLLQLPRSPAAGALRLVPVVEVVASVAGFLTERAPRQVQV